MLPASCQTTRLQPPQSASSCDLKVETDILIIGAGPAGLSLGFELERRGLRFLILEKGSVGMSWAKMPRNMKLASPWKANYLPGTPEHLYPANCEMSREEYLAYLADYAKRWELPVRTKTTVESIEQTASGGFLAHTADEVFSARAVVNASGYFSNPFVPQIAGKATIPWRHLVDYCDAETLRSAIGKPNPFVLIVGKRLSAGQVMTELFQAGFSLALSHRSPIQYGPGPLAWSLSFRIFPELERLKLWWKKSRAASPDVRMPGGLPKKLIQSGKVRTFPEISRFEGETVVFSDERRLQPDLVLFATGFQPALTHLSSLDIEVSAERGRPCLRELESTSISDLYFLGLDQGRNFQSRFIRGIRNDARFLAERLEKRFPGVRKG